MTNVEPKVSDDKKKEYIYDINAGCPGTLKIVHLPINKLNDNLIKTVKENISPSYKYTEKVNAMMTKWTFTNRYVERLHQIIKEHLPVSEEWSQSLNFIQTWGIVYKHQDFAHPHHHWPYTWSWIYYAQVDEKSSPLTLFNIMKENTTEIHNISLKPKTGQLIMFPSYVVHGVEKTGGIGEDQWRIVLSGDIILDPNANDKYKK